MPYDKASERPDRQLEKTLIALVYSVVAIALSLLLLFIYPQYSLYLIILTLLTTVLCISLTIRVMTSSEKALTYGGLANEILNSRENISRIDNSKGEVVIENNAAKKYFSGGNILQQLHDSLIDERTNILNFQRLELAYKNLKKETVILAVCRPGDDAPEDKPITNIREWYSVNLRPLSLKKSGIFEEEFSIAKIEKETYFLWNLENVTADKNMEKIFEEERQKLHNFVHFLPVGIYIANQNYILEYVNETFATQLSQTRESLIGKPLSSVLANRGSLLNPLYPDHATMALFHNGLEEQTELFVLQNNFKEGNEIKIRGLTIKEIPNDLTLREQIQYGIDKVDWLFNTSPSGIMFLDVNNNISLANKKAAEILETDDEKLSAKSFSEFVQPSTLKILKEIFQLYYENPASNEINKFETRLKSDKIVRIIVAPRRRRHSEKNTLEGLILYLIDTTEQKNLELKFAQAQKMQAMGQLAGGVAHDFNNLLTAMIGFCDLLLQRHGIGDPSFADLIQIKQNANRAAGLVRQLLAFSRKQPLKPKRIDVTENFIELSHLLKRILGEQISLEFNHGSDLGFIRVDPVQFSQVIINLAVNAKDAMEGKGLLRISTRAESLTEPYQFGADTIPPGDFVVISVTDTGCGIPEKNLNRIFEPFFSTKQNVVGSGTGLGLAMVYGIVRQTEGFIKVDSQLGKGTTFSIHLPRFSTAGEDLETNINQPKNSESAVLNTATGQSHKMILGLNVTALDHNISSVDNPQEIKILFVEDEDSVRTFGVRALKKKGFSVTACNCAENALELLNQGESFSLLITDMVMPGLSGAELAKIVKERAPETKIILASGYSEEIARRELAGSNDFEFIAKPYSLGDLTKKVFNILNK